MPFYLKARTPVDGWTRIIRRIMQSGMLQRDERGIETRWCDNVLIHIEDPYTDRVSPKYPFSESVLREKYASQLLIPDRGEFEYTYGERLNAWGTERINQLDYIVEKLKQNPATRRAVASTWDPRKDTKSDEVPCLNHFVFMVRDGFLDLSVTIRSNDMFGAWPANAYALGELLSEVSKRTEMAMGTVTTFSVNAHVYSHDWPKASDV